MVLQNFQWLPKSRLHYLKINIFSSMYQWPTPSIPLPRKDVWIVTKMEDANILDTNVTHALEIQDYALIVMSFLFYLSYLYFIFRIS